MSVSPPPAHGAGTASGNPNMAAGEHAAQLDAVAELAADVDPRLTELRDHLLARFDGLEVRVFRGELTLVAPPERLPELLAFCRDDPEVRCEVLMDLSAVHWPGGTRVENAQETTGWPSYEFDRGEGCIEVDYLLRSVSKGHRFRIKTHTTDEPDAARVPTATGVYGSAIFMEREVYDFFGIAFEGHEGLSRIMMPDDWVGHPQRKDYPLGGVEVSYKGGASIPPPDQRSY